MIDLGRGRISLDGLRNAGGFGKRAASTPTLCTSSTPRLLGPHIAAMDQSHLNQGEWP